MARDRLEEGKTGDEGFFLFGKMSVMEVIYQMYVSRGKLSWQENRRKFELDFDLGQTQPINVTNRRV